jgi:glucan biosynthesis protein C
MSQTAPAKGRLHHLDALRCVLMLLGIPYHASLIYAPGKEWRISSPDSDPAFAVLAELLHSFRMPAFFLLAGLLVAAAVRRAGPAGFLAGRARRLLVPLAVTALLLSTAQLWIVYAVDHPGQGAGFLASGALLQAWREGEWTLHLWFLIDLFLYAALAALAGLACAAPAGARALGALADLGAATLLRRPALLLAAGALYAVAVGGLSRVSPSLDGYVLFGTVEIQRFLFNLPFFAFGAVLGVRPLALARFTTPSVAAGLAAPAALAAAVLLPDLGSAAGKVAHHVLRGLAAWLCCQVLLSLAARLFPRRSAWVERLTGAAFTIYLMHHPVVIAAGALFLGVAAPPALEYAAIVLLSLGLSYAFHVLVVAPSPWARFLFNGADRPSRPGLRAPVRAAETRTPS